MIEVDGSKKSGSGTILRMSVALSAVTGQPLHIYNIRQSRPEPGLKPQHLEAVLTAAKICSAELKGAELKSRELWFTPGRMKSGRITAEIGTAGSIPMLLMTVLPICAYAEQPVQLDVFNGGTDVSNSPTINYVRFVLLPILKRMDLNASLIVEKYGYYPKGMGQVTINVEPSRRLKPILLESFGKLKSVEGISVCTFLANRKVAERQAKAARSYLTQRRTAVSDIQVINDQSNPLQKGSSLVLWAETDSGATLGSDAIGQLGKPSESVGEEAAEKLQSEISAKATVDLHLADMLILFMALAKGRSAYLTDKLSEHLETNIWLAEKLLDVKFKVEKKGQLLKVEKVS